MAYFAWALNAINEDLTRRRHVRRARHKGARGDSEPGSDVPSSTPHAGSPATPSAALPAKANANAQQADDGEPNTFIDRLTSALPGMSTSGYLPAYEGVPSLDTFSRVLFMMLAVFLVLLVSSISTSLTVMNSQCSTLDARSLPPPGSIQHLRQEMMVDETLVQHTGTVEPLLHADMHIDLVFDIAGDDERVEYAPPDAESGDNGK